MMKIRQTSSFWATVCKTVRPMLSDRCHICSVCLSVYLSVCNVCALWPNGWTYQDETWCANTVCSRKTAPKYNAVVFKILGKHQWNFYNWI